MLGYKKKLTFINLQNYLRKNMLKNLKVKKPNTLKSSKKNPKI